MWLGQCVTYNRPSHSLPSFLPYFSQKHLFLFVACLFIFLPYSELPGYPMLSTNFALSFRLTYE